MILRDADKQFESFKSEETANDPYEWGDDAGCRAILLGLALITVKARVAGTL